MKKQKGSKKIYEGVYLFNGLYISVYRGTLSNVWSIYRDEYCTDEYAVGFRTKADCMEFLRNENK
jgi:hypothetical protein